MSSFVVWGLPIFRPRAAALAIPDFPLARIIANSNRLNTPAICKNASLIEVGLPVPAVNRDAPHNHKAQFLFADNINDIYYYKPRYL